MNSQKFGLSPEATSPHILVSAPGGPIVKAEIPPSQGQDHGSAAATAAAATAAAATAAAATAAAAAAATAAAARPPSSQPNPSCCTQPKPPSPHKRVNQTCGIRHTCVTCHTRVSHVTPDA